MKRFPLLALTFSVMSILAIHLSSAKSTQGGIDKFALWQQPSFFRGAVMHPYADYDGKGGSEKQKFSKKDFQAVKDAGANVVSLNYPGPFKVDPPYEKDAQTLKYIDNAIQWTEEVGLYVIIHFRNGPGKPEESFFNGEEQKDEVLWHDESAQRKWGKMWRFVARRYKNKSNVIGYNLMVEPHPEEPVKQKALSVSVWNNLAKRITKEIRRVDKKTPIIVSSSGWAHFSALKDLKITGDSRTIYSFHMYEPFDFTHQGLSLAGTGNISSLSYPGLLPYEGKTTQWNKTVLEEVLNPVADFQKKHNVAVHVGEFGCRYKVPSCLTYLDDLISIFEKNGWHHTIYAWRDADDFDYEKNPYDPTIPQDAATIGRQVESSYLKIFKKYWNKNSYFAKKSSTAAELIGKSGTVLPDQSSTQAGSKIKLDLGVTDSYDKDVNLVQASRDGIKRYNTYIPWRTLEPKAGQYSFKKLDEIFEEVKENGMLTSLEIELTDVDCTKPEMSDQECISKWLPSDISFSRDTSKFDDPAIVQRLSNLVKTIMKRYDPAILTHVFVGNETDTYLRTVKKGTGRELFQDFQNLIKKIQDTVKTIPDPRPKFGTVYTFWWFGSPDYHEPHRKMAKVVETMGFTVYPTDPDINVPGSVKEQTKKFLDALRDIAGNTPIALPEIGHPAGPPPSNGSIESQKEFTQYVIEYIKEHRNAFEFASWFSMYDNVVGLPNSVFTFIGLQTTDGKKRPAYEVWAKQIF